MVNLNQLQNISTLELNTSLVTEENLVSNMTDNFVTSVPYWLMPVSIVMFITMVYFIYKKTNWGLDIVQTSFIASLMQIILSYILIKAGLSISIVPLTFWGLVWIILLISMVMMRNKY